jgi:hypothetical protein
VRAGNDLNDERFTDYSVSNSSKKQQGPKNCSPRLNSDGSNRSRIHGIIVLAIALKSMEEDKCPKKSTAIAAAFSPLRP